MSTFGPPPSVKPPCACVVVTRAAADCAPMLRAIASMGARAIAMPCIAQRPLVLDATLCAQLRTLVPSDAVAFASRHGVDAFAALLRQQRQALPATSRLFAVGAATAQRVQHAFGRSAVCGAQSDAEHLLLVMQDALQTRPHRVWLPTARQTRPILRQGLVRAGHQVIVLPLYETVVPQAPKGREVALWPCVPSHILFFSPSAVRGFLQQRPYPPGARALSLGPATSQALAEMGIAVAHQAEPHTAAGLLDCLRQSLAESV